MVPVRGLYLSVARGVEQLGRQNRVVHAGRAKSSLDCFLFIERTKPGAASRPIGRHYAHWLIGGSRKRDHVVLDT
jgi:hypothetical protein